MDEPTPLPEATPRPAPTTRWSPHYHRTCRGSITPPVLSTAQDQVVLCNGRFSLAEGRYEASAPLGVLALLGDAAITDDYDGGGVSLRHLDGGLVRHAEGGSPEHVAVSHDGRWLALIDRTRDGQRLSAWLLPELRRHHATEVPDGGGRTLALAVDTEGRARWYGERGCRVREVECPASVGPCHQRLCDPPQGLVLEPDGKTRDWAAVPPGLEALAMDPDAAWVLAVEVDGTRWLQPVDEPSARLPIPGRSAATEWPGHAIALTPGATTFAVSDADHVEAWTRDGDRLRPHHPLPYSEVGSLAFTADGSELLLTQRDDLVVLRTRPPAELSPAPSYDLPAPDGWVRAPEVDGVPTWPENEGSFWPNEPGIVAWYGDEEVGGDFRVVVGDRAEIARPELPVDEWARVVLDRIDDLPWEHGRIAFPHTLHTWVEDGQRRLELHYTTQDGCEHYEVAQRVAEHGSWLVRHELRTFEGASWRDAWAALVVAQDGAPPVPRKRGS
ncbi:MAG: hypothetical protein KC501_42555 [Myxococcales bacterium]|nr:hypothetical protein [Myxococcales bacterium]